MTFIPTLQDLWGVGCGAVIGFVLGVFGGGGSILAVPLLVYGVGVADPHVAIGTSALAVATNALVGLRLNWLRGTIRWRYGAIFASTGMVGSFVGAFLGRRFDGTKLLSGFAILMILVGLIMFRKKPSDSPHAAAGHSLPATRLLIYGFGAGLLSGFFGIGGGFLIVPGLTQSTGMSMLNAVGTSFLPILVFGSTTAATYAVSGLVEWRIAGTFILGGALGTHMGVAAAQRLARKRGALERRFALLIFIVAGYILWKSLQAQLA